MFCLCLKGIAVYGLNLEIISSGEEAICFTWNRVFFQVWILRYAARAALVTEVRIFCAKFIQYIVLNINMTINVTLISK